MSNSWSRKYPRCVSCGLTDEPHCGHGLCQRCYERDKNTQSPKKCERAKRGSIISDTTRKDAINYIIDQYINNAKSLQDIATELKCTRQYIYKLLKHYGINRRSRKDARDLAIAGGKLEYSTEYNPGNIIKVKHTQLDINREFFTKWSDNFAYVLGFIYTDGNLLKRHYAKKRKRYVDYYGITISQKDPEILEKIRLAMSLNKPIHKTKNKKDTYLHLLSFRDQEIFERLESLGLCDNKSLVLKFPEVPSQYLGGFVRGLFDGDGSYYGGNARLTTGSKEFAEGLKVALASAGFESTISMTPAGGKRKNPSFSLRVSTRSDSYFRFYLFLYRSANLFIPKKRKTFEESLQLQLPKMRGGDLRAVLAMMGN
jgi:AraC-like DNA-binding protein